MMTLEMGIDNQSISRVGDQSDCDDLREARMEKKTLRDDLPQVRCLQRSYQQCNHNSELLLR
jgi:hypothetical protein